MIERNIIGLVLTSQIEARTTTLEEKHFSDFTFKKIWLAVNDIVARGFTPDIITTSDLLDKRHPEFFGQAGWFNFLANIANDNLGKASADGHIRQIKLEWKKREAKNIGTELANSDEIDVNDYIKRLMALSSTERKYLHSYDESVGLALDDLDSIMSGTKTTIPTGLTDVDRLIGGLNKSDLIIVAARPAMGKTAFMLNMAAANENAPLVFSTEQSNVQAMQRLMCIEGGIAAHKMRTGELDNEDYARAAEATKKIIKAGGWIYDKSGPYMSEIEATAREVYEKHGCTAIYLDYLQRIKHERPSLPRHEQVGDIAMRLKELARELDVPVVALAQVSRAVESRTDKRPGMGDIKDSGTIEQEADSIMTLYRDEVYDESSPDKGICEVDFKKNRHGGTGIIKTAWIAPSMQFRDLMTRGY